jgi:hypothetical protein
LALDGERDPWDETAQRKPEKAEIAMERAKGLYRQLLDADLSGKLPKIL